MNETYNQSLGFKLYTYDNSDNRYVLSWKPVLYYTFT